MHQDPHEFGIDSPQGHIINGHTPVKVKKGESPVRAEGKEICIDGGFCKAYQGSTGIAGYTLIFNSHGIRIKSHYPFEDVYQALMNNVDIDSESTQVELEPKRVMIGDTDNGKKLLQMIDDLKALLQAYRQGVILEKNGPIGKYLKESSLTERTAIAIMKCILSFSIIKERIR